jgi:hypothetical protein
MSVLTSYRPHPGRLALLALVLAALHLGAGRSGAQSLSINDQTITEGTALNPSPPPTYLTTPVTFTVSLSAPPSGTVTVDWITGNGTARSGSDYIAASGTLTFPHGVYSRTITVYVYQDDSDENDEVFYVGLSNPVNATISDGIGNANITDDDAPPALSIANANPLYTVEGNSGTTTMSFVVSLSVASGKSITVDYATSNGTAVAPGDFVAIPTTLLSFNAGQTTKTISVTANGDTLDEANEFLYVNLSNAVNASISDNSGYGYIEDDDTSGISITDEIETEGDSGTIAFLFTVSLSVPNSRTVTVTYANGTAAAPGDYTAISPTTLTFAPGETSKELYVWAKGDVVDEGSETFFVNLSNPVNAQIVDAEGVGTIGNDDLSRLSINDVPSISEGNSGTVNATFTIIMSTQNSRTVTVDYETANGTAVSPYDYQGVAATTLSFAPGETTKPVTVVVNGDLLDEDAESFFVNLSNPQFAMIQDGQGAGTILDDDPTPSFSIANASPLFTVEGNTGTTTMSFTVSLSAPSGRTVSVEYATLDGTASGMNQLSPAGNYDYRSIPYNPLDGLPTLTFSSGEITKTVSLMVFGDILDEPSNESLFVDLSSPVNATLLDSQGYGYIQDDDTSSVTVSDASVTEGNSGTRSATFTVSLATPNSHEVVVTCATADGTATSPADYTAIPTTGLVFAPGETSKTISATVLGDTVDEANETFALNLLNATNAPIVDSEGICTILDDDVVGQVAGGAGPNGPLLVFPNAATVSNLDLSWGASCGAAVTDYAIYEGELGSFASHSSVSCTSVGGWSFPNHSPGTGDRYFLLVPLSARAEGSYGTSAGGQEIPAAAAPCRAERDLTPCP